MKYWIGPAVLGLSALGLMIAAAVSAPNLQAANAVMVNDTVILEQNLPRKLSDFGFFQNPAQQIPAANVVPYRLNIPLYSDGAEKLRFLYLPAGSQAMEAGEGLLELPVGAALIKTFAFGAGDDRQLIETRVLLRRADGWLALPYKWNDEQTDARLAIAGARVDLATPAGEDISYRVPNKNQCKECHGVNGQVVPIGPKARNLSAGWLEELAAAGKLNAVPTGHDQLPLWENRETADLTASARGYLDVNCAHCHRPGATASNSGLDLRWEQDNPHALGVNKRPVAAGRGSGGHLFDIVPGDADSSIMTFRMRSNEAGVAMPELGKTTIDQDGADIVKRWIEEMQ